MNRGDAHAVVGSIAPRSRVASSLIMSLVADGSGRRKTSLASTWIATFATVVLCVLAASSGSTRLWDNPDPAGTRTVRDQVSPAPQDEPRQEIEGSIDWPDLAWLLDVVNALAVVFLVLAIALAISDRSNWMWKLRRRTQRRAIPRMSQPLPEVRVAPLEVDFDMAGEALAVGTPRNAIVGCWMQLERDASAVGLARADSETAVEYVERVVASSSVDPGPIAELASLYREARFSRHELGDAHRAHARLALHGVAAQLSEGTREPV